MFYGVILFLHCSLLSPFSFIILVFCSSVHMRCAMRNVFIEMMLLRLLEDQSFVIMYISNGFRVVLLPSLHPSLLNFVKITLINNCITNDRHPRSMSHGDLQSLSMIDEKLAQNNPATFRARPIDCMHLLFLCKSSNIKNPTSMIHTTPTINILRLV